MQHDKLFVERLKAQDCKEIVAFLDEVFTAQNNMQMDFVRLFPRIFVETDEAMSWYYAIKENGKIVATAASHPFHYHLGDETLKVSASGNVAVSLSCRNRGFMQMVMNKINADMDAGGFDMACLHGDRRRYRTFGYERCGVEYTVTFNRSSVKLSGAQAEDTLSDLRNEPEQVLAEVMQIANSQPGSIERKAEDFIPALLTHYAEPLVIRNRNKEIIGYTALSIQKATIRELALKDPKDLDHVIATIVAYANVDSLMLRLPEYHRELTSRAVALGTRYQISPPANFRIVRFDNVVRAFMKAKHQYAPVLDGSLTVDSALFGKWCIRNDGGKIEVLPYEGAADIVIPDAQIHAFLFGPAHPLVSGVDTSGLSAEKAKLVGNWFPLPLFFPQLS